VKVLTGSAQWNYFECYAGEFEVKRSIGNSQDDDMPRLPFIEQQMLRNIN
jgi:hypothetical protein